MPLLRQPPGDTRCGAFALAYLRYIKQAEATSSIEVNEITEGGVLGIYQLIKFGDEFDGSPLAGYSDPVKMIGLLQKNQRAQVSFYVGKLDWLFNYVKTTRVGGIPDDITIVGADTLPELNNGDFFIAIVNDGSHYVLYYKKQNELHLIDPANGEDLVADSLSEAEGGILVRFN